MPSRARLRPFVAALAMALLLAGCGVSGLNFREDTRLRIVAPEDRAELTLPVTVRWTVQDFRVTGPDGSSRRDAGYFAVFVDRAPQPPGETLEWLAKDDDTCRRTRHCPDEEWLARRLVFPTSETELTIDTLPVGVKGRRELHELTIVLLDGQGRRIGESAFAVDFQVTRGTR